MATTRAESRQRTRASLRKAAAQSFAQSGVSSTSIEQIVLRAGFTRGAFYSNYDGKLDLLIDVLADRQIAEIGEWRLAVSVTGDVESVVAQLASLFSRRLAQQSDTPLLAVELEAVRNTEFRPHYIAYLDRLFDAIGQFVTALLHRCDKAAHADPGRIAVSIRALILTWSSQVVGESRAGAAIAADRAMRELLFGIIADTSDAGPHDRHVQLTANSGEETP